MDDIEPDHASRGTWFLSRRREGTKKKKRKNGCGPHSQQKDGVPGGSLAFNLT